MTSQWWAGQEAAAEVSGPQWQKYVERIHLSNECSSVLFTNNKTQPHDWNSRPLSFCCRKFSTYHWNPGLGSWTLTFWLLRLLLTRDHLLQTHTGTSQTVLIQMCGSHQCRNQNQRTLRTWLLLSASPSSTAATTHRESVNNPYKSRKKMNYGVSCIISKCH